MIRKQTYSRPLKKKKDRIKKGLFTSLVYVDAGFIRRSLTGIAILGHLIQDVSLGNRGGRQ